jgi:hypothetical protein
MSNDIKYDGFYFYPSINDNNDLGIMYSYFQHSKKQSKRKDHHENLFHILIFKEGDDAPILDDNFEAVLLDPVYYTKTLVENGFFGCVVKCTAQSKKWIKNYLDSIVVVKNS